MLPYYSAPAECRYITVVVSTDILYEYIYLHDVSTEIICLTVLHQKEECPKVHQVQEYI
jgi:hypothetical protein